MPEPDALELPEASDLYPVVCGFMRKLNVRASPGFDCIAAPFIKYAEREVPAANGRGVEKMNVLALYFARFFALMMEKAQILESWKAAKVTPLHPYIRNNLCLTPAIIAWWLLAVPCTGCTSMFWGCM